MRRLLARFGDDRRGAAALIVALALPTAIGFGALAVDAGSIYLTTRHLQGVADMAALAAANDPDHAQAAAQATADANPMDGPVTAEVVTGTYSSDPAVAVPDRFKAGAAWPTAARVVLHGKALLFFGAALAGRQSFDISRTATAAKAQFASFSIGSRLASVNGGIENALLTALTGSQVNLSVMDYNALATANVDLFDYVAALRTRLSLQGASYNTVLSTKVGTGTALQALADVLASGGQSQAAAGARTLSAAQPGSSTADLSQLIDPGPYRSQDHVAGGSGAKIALSAMDVADAVVSVANGGRQVKLDLNAAVPGLTSTTVWLAIGQRAANSPWVAIDDAGGVVVRTAQARLYLDSQVGAGGTVGGLGVALVHVPVYLELASAEARLSSLSCANGTVALSVNPSVGTLAIGEVNATTLNDFSQSESIAPATLVNLGPIKATASGKVDIGGGQWQTANFSAGEVSDHTVKTVSTQNLAQATLVSLVGSTTLNVQLFGLGLGVGQNAVTTALAQILGQAAAPLDGLIDGLESLLGVQLGAADVRVNGLRCNGAALVA